MIRLTKKSNFGVVCSVCKNDSDIEASTETEAIEEAKRYSWFILGKFHICPHCFSNALDQWKIDNTDLIDNKNMEGTKNDNSNSS